MQHITPKLSGHQSFAFRYGWLEKGYNHYLCNPKSTVEESMVALGVGKNMVQSILYWMDMTDFSPSTAKSLGNYLLSPELGRDQYLEDDSSLWLIHWKLCSRKNSVSAGSFAFSHLYSPVFSKDLLTNAILKHAETTSPATISRDIDCYLLCYAGTEKKSNQASEDRLNCPLENLGLIQRVPNQNEFKFSIGKKSSLPSLIVGYAIADYLDGKHTTNLKDLLYSPFSPGQVFKLDENTLVDHIRSLADTFGEDQFGLTETVGTDMALVVCAIKPETFLDKHFVNSTK